MVPGEAFGPSGFLRLSYALGDDDLVEGVGRIQTLLAEASRRRIGGAAIVRDGRRAPPRRMPLRSQP